MAIVEAQPTDLLGIPIPGEDSDPFYDQFVNYTNFIERVMFFRKLMVNLFIRGGGTITWLTGSSLLSWSDDFHVPVFHWGRRLNVVYGPDGATRNANIPSGSALVLTIPPTLNANRNVNFEVLARLDVNRQDQWVVGWNDDGVLQLRNFGELS